ncbi:hypothetical protein MBOT_18640 [Mycobacterium botniense]|uniref:Uncharacterized protein n=1 Tax=Mycobacterium botniense TaxID=84962 RepID=A0A7I9XXH5_9MYCO|nr:hypothetical protein MBOT_18640 [Mycobacterium botniense]
MTISAQCLSGGVQACCADVGQHDDPARADTAGDRQPYSTRPDDDQNIMAAWLCCHLLSLEITVAREQ